MADMLPEDDDGGDLARQPRHGDALGAHTDRLARGLLTGRHGFFHTWKRLRT